jgi:hypothetical protein
MLQDFGCSYVVIGHSERRAYHGETDAQVAAKTVARWWQASRLSSASARRWRSAKRARPTPSWRSSWAPCGDRRRRRGETGAGL